MKQTLKVVIFLGLLIFSYSPLCRAAQEPIVLIEICQNIEKRQPAGPTLQTTDRFAIKNNKLYAWMRINKPISGSAIHHAWYFKDRLMDDIRLHLKDGSGKVYSAKTVTKPYLGVWRVEVRQDDHALLETRYFIIESLNEELYATVLERGLGELQK